MIEDTRIIEGEINESDNEEDANAYNKPASNKEVLEAVEVFWRDIMCTTTIRH